MKLRGLIRKLVYQYGRWHAQKKLEKISKRHFKTLADDGLDNFGAMRNCGRTPGMSHDAYREKLIAHMKKFNHR